MRDPTRDRSPPAAPAAPTLFISDLHLDDQRPDITDLFCRFVEREAAHAAGLYILGDLFEAWIGDDAPDAVGAAVADALAGLAQRGVPCFFLHGNRDFLLGRRFAAACGLRLLPDPCVIALAREPVLLSHGDALCTGDVAYQQFRRQTRDPAWRARFLAQPVDARRAFAQQARAASAAHQRALMEPADAVGGDAGMAAAAPSMQDITDVAPNAVDALFRRFGIRRLIHGHTHRPAVHARDVDGRACERIVLGDWYTQGSVLRVAGDGTADLATL